MEPKLHRYAHIDTSYRILWWFRNLRSNNTKRRHDKGAAFKIAKLEYICDVNKFVLNFSLHCLFNAINNELIKTIMYFYF